MQKKEEKKTTFRKKSFKRDQNLPHQEKREYSWKLGNKLLNKCSQSMDKNIFPPRKGTTGTSKKSDQNLSYVEKRNLFT